MTQPIPLNLPSFIQFFSLIYVWEDRRSDSSHYERDSRSCLGLGTDPRGRSRATDREAAVGTKCEGHGGLAGEPYRRVVEVGTRAKWGNDGIPLA